MVQVFADLGLLGILVNAALLIAWALAVRRTLRTRGRLTEAQLAERSGLLTLLATVIVFGVHSTLDLTWFVPGWRSRRCSAPAGWPAAGRSRTSRPRRPRRPGRGCCPGPLRLAAVLGAVVLTVVSAWAIYQPLRSANADAAALKLPGRGRRDRPRARRDRRESAVDRPADRPRRDLPGDQGARRRPRSSC